MGSLRARVARGHRPFPVFLAIGSVATMSTSSTWASDRIETIERPETSSVSVIVPGVELRPLAGGHNGARGLFTGLLSLAPGAVYPFYARTVSEALVVLEGEAALDVEDRRYHLGPRAAAAVMPWQPRQLVNRSADRSAWLHVALASTTAEQSWINGRFVAVEQPPGATGRAGCERVCRHADTPTFELAPHRAVPGPLQRRSRLAGDLRWLWSLRARRAAPVPSPRVR